MVSSGMGQYSPFQFIAFHILLLSFEDSMLFHRLIVWSSFLCSLSMMGTVAVLGRLELHAE